RESKLIPIPIENGVQNLAAYGDSFGRITSLFTALGFGGLVITLLLQQRQIKNQEKETLNNRRKQEVKSYEDELFKVFDIYQKTLCEVGLDNEKGRSLLKKSIERVDKALVDDGVNDWPSDIKSRMDKNKNTEEDYKRINYIYFRNFKIVATEIHPQTRLIDTL